MWIRISKQFEIVGVNDYLFNHYMHDGEQISKNSKKCLKGYIRIFNKYKKEYNKNKTIKFDRCYYIAYMCLQQRKIIKTIHYLLECFITSPIMLMKKLIKKDRGI